MIEQGFPEDTPMLGARFLTLEDALWIAFRNNRNYQTQKELVYLAALDLTLARWRFAPRLFGVVSGDYTRDGAGEKSGSIASDFGWNWLMWLIWIPRGLRVWNFLKGSFTATLKS